MQNNRRQSFRAFECGNVYSTRDRNALWILLIRHTFITHNISATRNPGTLQQVLHVPLHLKPSLSCLFTIPANSMHSVSEVAIIHGDVSTTTALFVFLPRRSSSLFLRRCHSRFQHQTVNMSTFRRVIVPLFIAFYTSSSHRSKTKALFCSCQVYSLESNREPAEFMSFNSSQGACWEEDSSFWFREKKRQRSRSSWALLSGLSGFFRLSGLAFRSFRFVFFLLFHSSADIFLFLIFIFSTPPETHLLFILSSVYL